jgi:hypothetical protein
MRVTIRAVYPSFGRIVMHNRGNYNGEKRLIDGARIQAHSA